LGVIITILTVLLIIDCLLLIGIILLQRGKGQGLAGAFGVGGMEEALGTHAASTAQRITGILGAGFIVLAILVSWLKQREMTEVGGVEPAPTPAKIGKVEAPATENPAAPAKAAPGDAK